MDLEKRLEELEMRITFQEDFIESLNKVIADQGAMLDEVVKRYKKLSEQMVGLLEDGGDSDQPPPHY